MQPTVYILANRSHRVLYTGVTSDLRTCHRQHLLKMKPECFTAKHNATKLVYFEVHPTMESAIARKEQVKGGSYGEQICLIMQLNPEWRDLSIPLFAFG